MEKDTRRPNVYSINLYDIMGIEHGSSVEEIRSAYRRRALLVHPDKLRDATKEQKEEANNEFQRLHDAFQVLCEPEKRKDHDKYHGIESAGRHTEGWRFIDEENIARAQERQTWASLKETDNQKRRAGRRESAKHDKVARLERQREAKEEREMIVRMLDVLCSLGSSGYAQGTSTKCREEGRIGEECSRSDIRRINAECTVSRR